MPDFEAPYCLCIAGPNGSGKSTLVRALRTIRQIDTWIDPDVVADDLRRRSTSRQLNPKQISRAAFREARKMRVDCARSLQSFGFETVYSHPSNLDFLRALKSLGYVVDLFFVCTDSPEINVQRVANRVASGGHDVPTDRIRSRWFRSVRVLMASLSHIDRIGLFDNSSISGRARDDAEITVISGRRSILLNEGEEPLADWTYSLIIRQFSVHAIDPTPEEIADGRYAYITEQVPVFDTSVRAQRDHYLDQFLI